MTPALGPFISLHRVVVNSPTDSPSHCKSIMLIRDLLKLLAFSWNIRCSVITAQARQSWMSSKWGLHIGAGHNDPSGHMFLRQISFWYPVYHTVLLAEWLGSISFQFTAFNTPKWMWPASLIHLDWDKTTIFMILYFKRSCVVCSLSASCVCSLCIAGIDI